MIYLSKGIVQKGSTEQLLFVLYGGQKFELTGNAAAAWLNGRFKFAEALGRRPSEITKWLSGEHNFTIATLSRLSAFFGEPIISVTR